MKSKRGEVGVFIISILAIFLIFMAIHYAKISINAAASAGQVSLYVSGSNYVPPPPPVPEAKTICGNNICESGEENYCSIDCAKTKPIREQVAYNIFKIKLTSTLIILLIVIATIIAYLYLREDKKQKYQYPYYGWWPS